MILRIKKYLGHIQDRLGIRLPNFPQRKPGEIRIWIHSVSLGETKAVLPLIKEIRKDFPSAKIFLSTATLTGQKEAKGKGIDFVFFLPLDFSFVMHRLTRRISPDLFILVETDFWLNLFKALKKEGAKIALINGKLSTRSHKRFKQFPWFAKKLFSYIDLFCLQSQEHESRFLDLSIPKEKIVVTGNIKFDMENKKPSSDNLYFPQNRIVITIASTHDNEEELLLNVLEKTSSLVILLAPRHPERFDAVAETLKQRKIPYRRISEKGTGEEKVVLIDRMGILDLCYQISSVTIVGGSFVSHVGGHNIYEPVRLGTPVIYGPFMHKQEGLVKSLKKHNIGDQVELADLEKTLTKYIDQKSEMPGLSALKSEMEGATKRSWELIKNL